MLGYLEDRRSDVDRMAELAAETSGVLDMAGPVHDHRVPGPAEVGRDLLAPLEWGVAGPRPGRRAVRRRLRASPGVHAAAAFDERPLLFRSQSDAVVHGQFVEGAGEGALQGGAVVAPDVEDQRVVQLAHPLHLVEHPTDVVVSVLLVGGVNLHLPGIQGSILRRQ